VKKKRKKITPQIISKGYLHILAFLLTFICSNSESFWCLLPDLVERETLIIDGGQLFVGLT
jgi:hypothetical protein